MKILLIQPPFEDFYTTPIRLYPLALTYVAATFQQLGHTVRILDCLSPLKKRQLSFPEDFYYLKSFLKSNPYLFKGYYRFGIGVEEIVARIRSYSPDIVGISSNFTAYYKNVHELVQCIKSNFDLPVFIGGHHASVFYDEIQRRTPSIDFVLKGTAEEAVPKFLSHLEGHRPVETLTIDWKKLMPAHHVLQDENYKIGRKNYLSLTVSRGCPYNCDFCSIHAMTGHHIEYREIDHVMEEMRENYCNHSVRVFNFEDDNLSFRKQWFADFLKAVIDDSILKDIELTAMNGLCYSTLDADILALMKKAGFQRLNLSLISHDEAVRIQHQRPKSHQTIEGLIDCGKRLGFHITVYIIMGLPDQTYEDIKDSVDYLLGQEVLVGPSVFYIPAGSRLYYQLPLTDDVLDNWNLYRSSAFAVETKHLSRADLIDLFSYCRQQNLAR